MSEHLVFVNRRFVPEEKASFSVFDRGLLYGDGLFETVRVYGGKFFRLAAHIRRLYSGLKCLGIRLPYTQAEMEIFTRELALHNRIGDGFARIVVSRGEGLIGYSPRGSVSPHVAICARSRQFDVGQKTVWRLTFHSTPVIPLPLKSLSYLPHVMAKMEAEKKRFDDAILLNPEGQVVEATGSNLFLWSRGAWVTPPLSVGCLPGITRGEFIKVARQEGYRVVERNFGKEECLKADGILLTSSLMEIMPASLNKKMDMDVLSELEEIEAAFAYYRSMHCI